MGKGERLVLSFDDLEGDVKEHYYRFIHCDADWEPSSLNEGEYLEGYYEDRIRGERFSFDTEEDYTHYRLDVPNEQTRITRSGNYLLYVYRDTGEIEPVLTRRFMVVSPRGVKLDAEIGRSNEMDRFDSGQQLKFEMRYPDLEVSNPMRAFKVVVQQNGRWDNAAFEPEVTHMQQDKMVFGEQGDATLFQGGNEFRAFDTRILSGNAQQVRRVERDSNDVEHVYLKRDQVRGPKGYYSDKDINGDYLIRTRNVDDHELSAEYVWVHFRLERSAPVTGGNVYVFGDLSDMQCLPSHRMRYDHQEGAYLAQLYLKQGYYEYQYAFLSDDRPHADLSELEGSFYETENDYRILVYYQGVNDRADRLVKVEQLNSRKEGPTPPGQGG